jgi:hypothetical protein
MGSDFNFPEIFHAVVWFPADASKAQGQPYNMATDTYKQAGSAGGHRNADQIYRQRMDRHT